MRRRRGLAPREPRAPRASRVRLVGRASVAAPHRRSPRRRTAIPTSRSTTNEVTTAGRLELLPFLHEQSITITAHRFGNPDPWSEAVI